VDLVSRLDENFFNALHKVCHWMELGSRVWTGCYWMELGSKGWTACHWVKFLGGGDGLDAIGRSWGWGMDCMDAIG